VRHCLVLHCTIMVGDYRTSLSLQTMKSELKSVLFWRNVCVELLSVIMLIVLIVMSLTTLNTHLYIPGVLHFGLLFSFLVFLLIEGYGPVGGAIMNPPAAISLCLAGHFTPLRGLYSQLTHLFTN